MIDKQIFGGEIIGFQSLKWPHNGKTYFGSRGQQRHFVSVVRILSLHELIGFFEKKCNPFSVEFLKELMEFESV